MSHVPIAVAVCISCLLVHMRMQNTHFLYILTHAAITNICLSSMWVFQTFVLHPLIPYDGFGRVNMMLYELGNNNFSSSIPLLSPSANDKCYQRGARLMNKNFHEVQWNGMCPISKYFHTIKSTFIEILYAKTC